MPLHVEIKPIPCQVASSFLFRDETKTDWVPGKIIAVSSYPSSTPTFKVLLEDGALFSYVPTSVVRTATSRGELVSVKPSTFTFKTCKDEVEPIYDGFKDFLKKKGPHPFYSFPLQDLCYNDCPSENMTVVRFEELTGKPVHAYLKRCKLFIEGTYLCTLDWGDANVLLHLLELENGQFAFLPSHKVLFANNPQSLHELPRYRAVKGTFSVET